jgi:hypothetical protein
VSRIPFSVYDFFGYLTSGFLVLAALDLVFTALRHEAWRATSQPCGPVSLPPDAAMQ